jgi:hypothetical protein
MNDRFYTPASPTFHPHWLAYWQALAVIALLIVVGFLGLLLWPPLGLFLWGLALGGAIGTYLYWRWHFYVFTTDKRLIRQRGILGCASDVITLFGVITPYQTPLLGEWLDVGSVHLGIPGPDIRLRHIAHFREFCSYLVVDEPPARDPPVQVFIQMPPLPYDGPGWQERLPPRGPNGAEPGANRARR